MMQPIDISDQGDLLHSCSRLDGDFKGRTERRLATVRESPPRGEQSVMALILYYSP